MSKVNSKTLYIDDIRTPKYPEKWDHISRTYYDATLFIKTNTIKIISIDHDLGERKTGSDIVKFMIYENRWPTDKIYIHSSNPVGVKNMSILICRYCPSLEICDIEILKFLSHVHRR